MGLAVLGAGIGLRASAAPAPGKEEARKADSAKADEKKGEKKDEPRKRPGKAVRPGMPFPDLDELFERLPPGIDQGELKELRKQMEQLRKEMERALQGLPGAPGLPGMPGLPGLPGIQIRAFPGGAFGGLGRLERRGSTDEPRLGAEVRAPSATLTDQLDLPKGQGLVLEELAPNSAAAKAGLKKHDILLELNGKAVPSKADEFRKVLAEVKPNTPVEAVVLRKGKRETIKGLALPEAKAVARPGRRPLGGNVVPNVPGFLPGLGGVGGSMTTVSRNGDEFTTRHQAGGVRITVKGKVARGTAEVSEVQLEEGGKTTTYSGVDKVPAEYREKVKKLAAMGARGTVRLRLGD
jgi:membrane-associated protease RseP (regulator of RpoE activity)